MPELGELRRLCADVNEGTTLDQKLAWRQLTRDGKLWQTCQAVAIAPSLQAVEELAACFADLHVESTRRYLCTLYDPYEAERLGAAACRLIAAAILASQSRLASQLYLEADLFVWACRAVAGSRVDGASPTASSINRLTHADRPRTIVTNCFRSVAGLQSWADGQIGAAQSAALMLLEEHQPSHRLANVPVLLVENAGRGSGLLAHLSVELLPDGSGQIFPSPRMFRSFGRKWRTAIEGVRQRFAFGADRDVQWAIDTEVADLDGASVQAAFQGALRLLHDGRAYDRDCAISATLDGKNNLGHVEGLVGPHGVAGPKLVVAEEKGLKRIVISPVDFQALDASARHKLKLEILPAATLEQALDVASGLATGLRDYCSHLFNLPDANPAPYLGEDRQLTSLYVPPDVCKRGRPSFDHVDEANPVAGAWDDIDVEQAEEADRRLPWSEEQTALERGQSRMAVVLADAGHGKSLLLQMTARQRAEKALMFITDERSGVERVPLTVILPLGALCSAWRALSRQGTFTGKEDPDALRESLRTALREHGCPKVCADYLGDHAGEERSWLLLDGRDEVLDESGIVARVLVVLAGWACRVVITSRRSGFRDWERTGIAFTEYRLAPLSEAQARQFVESWVPDHERRSRLLGLLRSRSIRQVCQSPFLLTLLCWVSERHELSLSLTRTRLYDLMIKDALGCPPGGSGPINGQRGEEWLPCLRALAGEFYQLTQGRTPLPKGRLLDLLAQSPDRPLPLGLTPAQAAELGRRQQAIALLTELTDKRLLILVGAGFIFPHRSILEFLNVGDFAEELDAQVEALPEKVFSPARIAQAQPSDLLDAVILSDIHLGSTDCQARRLIKLLEQIRDGEIATARLILNGDILDSIDYRRLTKFHWKVLSLIRKLSDQIDVVWLIGEHDGSPEIFSHLMGVSVEEEFILDSGPERLLVLHGSRFDEFMDGHPWLTWWASVVYFLLQRIDPSHSLARFAKKSNKIFQRWVRKIAEGAIEYARRRGCTMVACGHTHTSGTSSAQSVRYFNSGCWTELPCTYLTVARGQVSLHRFNDDAREPTPTESGSQPGLRRQT